MAKRRVSFDAFINLLRTMTSLFKMAAATSAATAAATVRLLPLEALSDVEGVGDGGEVEDVEEEEEEDTEKDEFSLLQPPIEFARLLYGTKIKGNYIDFQLKDL